MKLAANLTFLFGDAPMWKKIDAAADAGFAGVEVLQPYGENAADLRHRLDAAGPSLVLINTSEPDWDAGGRGYAAVPGAGDRFRASLDDTLAFADTAACPRIHILAGIAEGEAARESYLANLAHAADQAPDMAFSIEPLNALDQPGYFLNGFELALGVLEELSRPNLGLQFDTYHAARMGKDLSALWERCGAWVRHVQVAGPDRHEPGPGEVAFLRHIGNLGYTGWISGEYVPAGRTEDGLDWLTQLRA